METDTDNQRRRQRWARMLPGIASAAICAEGSVLSGTAATAMLAAGLAAGAAAGTVAFTWRRLGVSGRLYGCSVAAYAAFWAGEVSAHGGPFWHGSGWLLAGAAVMAAPWSYRRRWRWKPDCEPDLPVPEFEEVGEFRRVWLDYVVSVPNSPLADAQLTPEWEVPGGRQADILLPRGRKSTEDAIGAVRLLRSAWDAAPTQVLVEPTPDRKSTKARLTVLERDVLADAPRWGGPTLDPASGLAAVGTFPDSKPVHWKFWTPHSGAANGLIAGEPGSGKSRFGDKLLCEMHLSPLIIPWIMDGQGGISLPAWVDAADRFAMGDNDDVDDILATLRAMRRVAMRRKDYFSPKNYRWTDDQGRRHKGKGFFDPTPEMPLLIGLLEEAHVTVKHETRGGEALRILGDVGKLGRKVGVGIILVNQLPSLDELGGHKASVVRAMLRGGNVVSFKTGESVSHHMLGLRRDPSKLPQLFADGSTTQGLGYINGYDSRDVEFRSEYVDENTAYDVADMPAAGQLDALSAAAAEAPDDPELAPKHIPVPGIPRIALMPSAAERKTWADKILPLLGDGADHSFGSIFKALPEGTSDRSVRHGLKQLVEQGHAWTAGPKQPYRITDAGRAELERRGVAA